LKLDFPSYLDPTLKPLFAKVRDRFFLCETRRIAAFTDFYDPAKWTAFFDMIQHQSRGLDVQAAVFGGDEDCERRMLGFFPADDEEIPFPISRLRIKHNSKFNKAPRHQDYLGAILGLGLDRGRIGDIFTSEAYADVFVCRDISGYICEQLTKAGRIPVTVCKAPLTESPAPRPGEITEKLNVASLRLDVVVAALFRLSRGQTSALIEAEKVYVNWSPCTAAGNRLKPGDMVTLRGHGRWKIGDILGTTKKGRLRINVLRSSNK